MTRTIWCFGISLVCIFLGVACTRRPEPTSGTVAASPDAVVPPGADTSPDAVVQPGDETSPGDRGPDHDGGARGGGLQAAEIASGNFHTCARLLDGSVRCWGMNSHGQLGDGTRENRPAPVVVSGVSDVVQIAAEGFRTCAVTGQGELWCWGQLMTSLPGADVAEPLLTPRRMPGFDPVRRVALSFDMECAVTDAGHVMCRGANTRGGLGDGTTEHRQLPVRVQGLDSAVEVAAGYGFACALLRDATMRCWGWNDSHGQIGDGSGQDRHEPTPVSGLRDVVDLDAGFTHACAVRRDGALLCWGANTAGVLGDGTTQARPVPNPVPGISDAVSVVLSSGQTCVVLRDGSGRCWGADSPRRALWRTCPQPESSRMEGPTDNGGYRVGPEEPYCPVPTRLLVPIVRQVSPASLHACVIDGGGAVLCWGNNFYGSIGDGRGDGLGQDRDAPTSVLGP